MPGNSGSRSGTGGGKRLSRWLLVAHWRCTEAFDLSLSPSAPFSPSPSLVLPGLAPSFSVSSFDSSSLPAYLTQVSLSAPRSPSPFPRDSSFSPLHRVNPYTHTHTKVDPSSGSLHSVSARLASIPFPSAPRYSPDHPLGRFPSFSPFILLSPCRRPGDVAACYDLHSSRNKTFATTPADDKRNCALSVL